MTTIELKPCPFCGNAPKLDVKGVQAWGCDNLHDFAMTYIRCNRCDATPMVAGRWNWRGSDFDNKTRVWCTHEEATAKATERAVESWNTRAPVQQAGPVGEVVDMKYGRVKFHRKPNGLDAPYLQPGTPLYTAESHPSN